VAVDGVATGNGNVAPGSVGMAAGSTTSFRSRRPSSACRRLGTRGSLPHIVAWLSTIWPRFSVACARSVSASCFSDPNTAMAPPQKSA
jgi:hypothetical protein